MKTEEIIKGNKLIAEFMGLRWNNIPVSTKGRLMEYHSSWDWLMPVVEKINMTTGFDLIIFKTTCHINDMREHLDETTLEGSPEKTFISFVWEAVIKAIKLYNQSK